jgi:hypothetical protein
MYSAGFHQHLSRTRASHTLTYAVLGFGVPGPPALWFILFFAHKRLIWPASWQSSLLYGSGGAGLAVFAVAPAPLPLSFYHQSEHCSLQTETTLAA